MTQPTHTHRTSGGRFTQTGEQLGGGALEGQLLVFYHDLDKDISSITTETDWRQNWRLIAPDDCTVCMGTGTDHIKGNKANPCGHCFGLGKVMESGKAAGGVWDLAAIATGIIKRQQAELNQLGQVANNPSVKALIEQQRQQAIDDSTARLEQEWRNGKGFGSGGQRYTGD